MDPKANLNEQLRLAKRFLAIADRSGDIDRQMTSIFDPDEVERLAELVIALDGWLESGGFSPWPRK